MTSDEALSAVTVFADKMKKVPDSQPLTVAVDPGASGAIAFQCGHAYAVIDIPVIKVERGGKKKGGKQKQKTAFDYVTISYLFKKLIRRSDDRPRYAIVEEGTVGIPGKGNSAYNGFRVGCNFGMWALFLVSQGFAYQEVRPSVWKRSIGLIGKDKETSRHQARMKFPLAPLARKKDHDRAEALLLSDYLRLQLMRS